MDKFTASFVMTFLFALRCLVPLALTVLIGWAMNRLVDKWEAEEAAAVLTKPVPIRREQMPALSARPSRTELVRCWVFRDCGRTDCAAYQNPDVICWQKKTDESGHLPVACTQCAYYQMTRMFAAGLRSG